MNTIKLENKYLVPTIEFLQSMKLKAKESRARSKFVKLLNKALEDLQESEQELLLEFAELDAEGNLATTNGGTSYILKEATSAEYHEQHNVLLDEVAELLTGTYTTHIENLVDVLDNYTGELEGVNAEVYDRLLDALEDSQEKGGAK